MLVVAGVEVGGGGGAIVVEVAVVGVVVVAGGLGGEATMSRSLETMDERMDVQIYRW